MGVISKDRRVQKMHVWIQGHQKFRGADHSKGAQSSSMSGTDDGHAKDIEFKRVLTATDFSEASRNALRYAAAIARNHAARLYIVHVVSSLGIKVIGADAEVQAAELAARELKELWTKLGRSNPSSKFELALLVRQGQVSTELEAIVAEEDIDLVVPGTHARTGLSKIVLGSVAEEIFRKSSRPVLTVGPASSWSWPQKEVGAEKFILFATDFGEASTKALPYAVSIANRSGSKLVMLHVAKTPDQPGPVSIVGNTADAIGEDVRQRSMQRLRAQVPGNLRIEPELRVIFGAPADGILAEASGTAAGLIVLGVRHDSLFVPAGHSPSTVAYEAVMGANCAIGAVKKISGNNSVA